MRRVQKFLALPLRRQLLVLQCWFWLNATAIGLKTAPLPRILRFLGTNATLSAPRGVTTRDEILWSVRAAAALSWNPTCAVRGLVAERMLRLHGWPAQFKVGVARDQSDFHAHAWVEDESGILIGAAERQYQDLPAISARDLVTPS